MQAAFIFIIYVFLFTWLITSIAFIKKTNLPITWITGLFALKLIAALVYACFYLQPAYYATSDTWNYFKLSKSETDILLTDPLAFFKELFGYTHVQAGNLFIGKNSYWNDLKSNVIIKLLAICNVFTLKNYFADLVIFNFLFFFSTCALYRLLQQVFAVKKIFLVAFVFCIPSFLFWCSGLHKDGLMFSCIAVIIYCFYRQLAANKIILAYFLFSLICFILLFAQRNFMAFLLLPALLAWYLCYKYPARSKLIVVSVWSIGIILFFSSPFISHKADLPQYIIERQAEFNELTGNSKIDVPPLENNLVSFIKFLPSAIDMAFFRPHVTELHNTSYLPAIAEVLLLWGAIIVSFFFKRKKATPSQRAYILFCIIFSVSFLLIAGYTITFSGAIVRYRAMVLPFLFTPFLLYFTGSTKNFDTSSSNSA